MAEFRSLKAARKLVAASPQLQAEMSKIEPGENDLAILDLAGILAGSEEAKLLLLILAGKVGEDEFAELVFDLAQLALERFWASEAVEIPPQEAYQAMADCGWGQYDPSHDAALPGPLANVIDHTDFSLFRFRIGGVDYAGLYHAERPWEVRQVSLPFLPR